MKQTLLTIATMLALTLVAQADQYVLVMSKDDEVCQSVLKIYNNDLREHGKIIPENHKEFNHIEWENANFMQHNGKVYSPIELAQFDINNNGVDELVVKIPDVFGSADKAPLIVYMDTKYYSDLKKGVTKNFFREEMERYASIPYGESAFTELPPQSVWSNLGTPKNHYFAMSNGIFSFPLTLNNTFYMAMFGNGFQITSFDETTISLLAKYDAENKLNHVCYFFKQ